MIYTPPNVTPYCPYSGYQVRAVVTTVKDGRYEGCNIENVNYSLTIHAEQAAIVAAYMGEQPKERKFIKAIQIWTKDGGTPCGGCRQAIHEFATDDCMVHLYSEDGNGVVAMMTDLLPRPFGPESLGQ